MTDKDFVFKVNSSRWGHSDSYTVRHTKTGWYISHIAISGDCDKGGNPYLFDNLNHDSINYPNDLSSYFNWLWSKIESQNLTEDDVQQALDELAAWVSLCEENAPGSDVWKGLAF